MRHIGPGWRFSVAIFICLLLSLAALIYPVYVIRPFRAQGLRELIAALTLVRFRLPFVAVCALLSVAALVWYWKREKRRLRRTGSLAGALAVIAVALLCRINIYELMFHPFERPSFSAAAQVKLDGDEKVISIRSGNAARAYPIRVISIITLLTTIWRACRSSRRIEHSVTPVWCGDLKLTVSGCGFTSPASITRTF